MLRLRVNMERLVLGRRRRVFYCEIEKDDSIVEVNVNEEFMLVGLVFLSEGEVC